MVKKRDIGRGGIKNSGVLRHITFEQPPMLPEAEVGKAAVVEGNPVVHTPGEGTPVVVGEGTPVVEGQGTPVVEEGRSGLGGWDRRDLSEEVPEPENKGVELPA